jgi:hypothetical protein
VASDRVLTIAATVVVVALIHSAVFAGAATLGYPAPTQMRDNTVAYACSSVGDSATNSSWMTTNGTFTEVRGKKRGSVAWMIPDYTVRLYCKRGTYHAHWIKDGSRAY